MKPASIATINLLPWDEKKDTYCRFIPSELLQRFTIHPDFTDVHGRSLITLSCEAGTSDVELDLRHRIDAEDPLLYAHLTDTINGQIHVLLYVVNDPDSPRFDVDRMPDGTRTRFGIMQRNIEAEIAAMRAGLAPGQVRQGLRLLRYSTPAFEAFVESLGHDLFFVEPLSYHNAVVFERYGMGYVRGQNLMEHIHTEFQASGTLHRMLDASTPFREPEHATSIRGRSWAIHDGILGQVFSDVTMYKNIQRHAGIETFPDAVW